MDQIFSWKTPVIWGGALFSMFFGAGNMIYSLWLGHIVDRANYWSGLGGFLLAAVLFPFVGLFAISSQRGCVFSFLAPISSRPIKVALLTVILCVWGPLGAMPRAVLMTYSSLQPFLPCISPFIGHLLLCLLVGLLITSPQRMISLFGRWLMPGLLLASIGVFCASLTRPSTLTPSALSTWPMFQEGVHLGYQTMDGLAAIFFGKLLVEMFAQQRLPKKLYRRFFTITFATALALLVAVYMMLIESAARLTEEIHVGSPIMLMVEMSCEALGPWIGFIVALLMTGAALSTAIALALIVADFFHANLLQRVPYMGIVWSLIGVTYLISLMGIEGIHLLSGPALEVLYPMLLLLSLYLLLIKRPLLCFTADPHLVDQAAHIKKNSSTH